MRQPISGLTICQWKRSHKLNLQGLTAGPFYQDKEPGQKKMKDTIGLINGKQTSITENGVKRYPYCRILIRRRQVFLYVDDNLQYQLSDESGLMISEGVLSEETWPEIIEAIQGRLINVSVETEEQAKIVKELICGNT